MTLYCQLKENSPVIFQVHRPTIRLRRAVPSEACVYWSLLLHVHVLGCRVEWLWLIIFRLRCRSLCSRCRCGHGAVGLSLHGRSGCCWSWSFGLSILAIVAGATSVSYRIGSMALAQVSSQISEEIVVGVVGHCEVVM